MNNMKQEIINCGGIENYLRLQQHKFLLRFLTCGSVDDGKSTLIGRLLYDSAKISEDQLSLLRIDSKNIGTQKNKLDLSLLLDGLQLEREQGITIDVAYRYFFTKKRKFIIADTPGHEEYTKNMATGASVSELAVLLVDARKGIRDQTRRHWFISVIFGIKHIIVAVNKMDLVNYSEEIFQKICKEYLEFTKGLFDGICTKFVPISALDGDNIILSSVNMQWYNGPTLLEILENINVKSVIDIRSKKFRLPVQYVIHHLDFRGYSGTVSSGKTYVGQNIRIFPSNTTSCINRIIIRDQDKSYAYSGEAVTVTLKDDVDVSRGDMLFSIDEIIIPVQRALVNIIWMATDQELSVGHSINVKIASKILRARVENILHQIDIYNFSYKKSNKLPCNSIGLIELLFDEYLVLDRYVDYPITGSMIFIDLLTNETVGAGMVYMSIKNDSSFNVKNNKNSSEFELALHALIRRYFPHWNLPDLLKSRS